MGSPGNATLTSFKPLSNSMLLSPVRVGATFEKSSWTVTQPKNDDKNTAIDANGIKKELLGLPPTGKRARNAHHLPNISNTMADEQIENLRHQAA